MLPCALAYVIKSIEGYDEKAGEVTIKVTLIMRVKLGELRNNEKLKEILIDKLKWRIAEEEELVRGEKDGVPKLVKGKDAKSYDVAEGKQEDIMQWTLRKVLKAGIDDSAYADFPFDTLEASIRLELSHF